MISLQMSKDLQWQIYSIVDEMNIADLSEEKQQAFMEWVENGGTY